MLSPGVPFQEPFFSRYRRKVTFTPNHLPTWICRVDQDLKKKPLCNHRIPVKVGPWMKKFDLGFLPNLKSRFPGFLVTFCTITRFPENIFLSKGVLRFSWKVGGGHLILRPPRGLWNLSIFICSLGKTFTVKTNPKLWRGGFPPFFLFFSKIPFSPFME